MAGSISLSGVFSGIDTSTLITQLMQIESQPLIRLQNTRIAITAKQSAMADIQKRLGDLNALVSRLRDATSLRQVSAATSNNGVLTVSATTGATEGVHQVEVNQLATAAREVQAGVAQRETWTANLGVDSADSQYLSADEISDALGTNYQFVFKFGSEPTRTVDLSAYDATGITLNQLVSEINTAAGYAAASAVNDGGQWKLQLKAASAGTGKDLTITDSNSVDALDSTSDFTKTLSGVAGGDTVVGAGQFVYTYNGVTRTLAATSTTTLQNLVDLINKDSGNPGMTASILDYDVSGDPDKRFHLVLSGGDSGQDYGITIGAGTTVAGFAPGANWTQTQAAVNAQIRVDGYPAGNWIERSSNTISDVIQGVTINLVSPGTASVTLTRSTSQLNENMTNLVNIYNGIATQVKKYTGYNTDTKTGGVLEGDSLVSNLLSQIRNIYTGALPGFVDGKDSFNQAAQLGITIDKSGQLSLDTDVLDQAVTKDYAGVLKLLNARRMGASDSDYIQFSDAADTTTDGVYDVQVEFDSSGNIVGTPQIRAQGAASWDDADLSGNTITGKNGTPEQLLQVVATWDGTAGVKTAQVRVQKGLAERLYDVVNADLDPTEGSIVLKNNELDDNMTSINNRIDQMQKQLDDKQTQLKAKFARMEATLARLDSQRAQFQALFQTLGANTASGSSSSSSSFTS